MKQRCILKPFIVDAEPGALGGWEITRPDGLKFTLTDEDFKRHYDPLEGDMGQQGEELSYREMVEQYVGARRTINTLYQSMKQLENDCRELKDEVKRLSDFERLATVIADGQITKGEMIGAASTLLDGSTAQLDMYESWMIPKEEETEDASNE